MSDEKGTPKKKKASALSGLLLADTTDGPVYTPNTGGSSKTESSDKDKKSYLLWLDPSVHKRLKIYAASEDTSINKAIAEAIELLFAEKGI